MSEKERIEDIETVLRLMMEELGDERFDAVIVDGDKGPYNRTCLTTWRELLNRTLVSELGGKLYEFTGNGWLKGVELLKLTEDPGFAAKMSKLSTTLRGYVTRRPPQN